ncbi:MAG: GNAT family N-acetyltransferase, partial [Methylocystaceae bacterium]|nr:GNAT family N-acetyltransferase [Methylocystaceae bacterium]
MIFNQPYFSVLNNFAKTIRVRLRAKKNSMNFSKAMAGLSAGATLKVFATDPGAVKDFEAFCKTSGNVLKSASEADGVLVGDMQLRHCDFTMPEGALEMGLELLPEVRGKGIGTQALKEVARYAFAQGHHRVEGSTTEGNIGMRKSFEKAGWVFEGVLRNLFVEDGAP